VWSEDLISFLNTRLVSRAQEKRLAYPVKRLRFFREDGACKLWNKLGGGVCARLLFFFFFFFFFSLSEPKERERAVTRRLDCGLDRIYILCEKKCVSYRGLR